LAVNYDITAPNTVDTLRFEQQEFEASMKMALKTDKCSLVRGV